MAHKFTKNVSYVIHPFPCQVHHFIAMCRLYQVYVKKTKNLGF